MNDYEILIVTGNRDHNSDVVLQGIKTGEWVPVLLPGQQVPVQVLYAEKEKISRQFFSSLLKEKQPAVLYLNGIFSFRFVVLPLIAARSKKIKTVLCPRGMLQAGALAGKSLKKKIYLKILKLSGLVKNICWHATNEVEATDIRKIFGNDQTIIVASNIPKWPYPQPVPTAKEKGVLRMVYISLLAAKKNLLQVIELVNNNQRITLDIYGPVKDRSYWQSCLQAMTRSGGRVQYKGELKPEEVQSVFSKYDASVLLTRGENFGHALYESLSVGRPVITSHFTPWTDLEARMAGWNLDIADDKDCAQKLTHICELDANTYNDYCKGALKMAKEYFNASCSLENYQNLFSN